MSDSRAENDIRARRQLTNDLIAGHDVARLRALFDPKVNVIAGDGRLIVGADAVVKAFATQFSDPTFVTYVRTAETIAIDKKGARAAECGRWVGSWQSAGGGISASGQYLAAWRKSDGGWVIESELFVTLR